MSRRLSRLRGARARPDCWTVSIESPPGYVDGSESADRIVRVLNLTDELEDLHYGATPDGRLMLVFDQRGTSFETAWRMAAARVREAAVQAGIAFPVDEERFPEFDQAP